MAVGRQYGFEGVQDEFDVGLRAGLAHQSDPPHVAGERAQAGADLDAVRFQELPPHTAVVHAVRDGDAVQHPQPMPVLRGEPHAQRGESRGQRAMVPFVPSVSRLQPFFADQTQGLPQRIIHGDGRGVVVHAILAPVFLQHAQVQIPTLDLVLPLAHRVLRRGTERDGRQPGRTTQAFLGAAVTCVDAPLVDLQRAAGQRRDRIDQQQGAGVVHGLRHAVQRLPGAGGRFGVDQGGQFGSCAARQPGPHVVRGEDAAPFGFDDDRGSAAAFDHVGHARAENTVDADHHLVAGLHEVDETRFHARAAGAGDGQRQGVLGLEHPP